MEEYISYIKKFKIALIIIIAALAVDIFLLKFIVPEFKKISENQSKYKEMTKKLNDSEKELKDLKETLDKEKIEDEQAIKAFFKPVNLSTDNDSAISEEFAEILQLLRENKIKTRTLKFVPDPPDDNFVKHVGNKYYVSKVTADIIATYSELENFLRDLYKHEHFLEISQIEIKPYDKNKRILLVNLQIKLYSQKDESVIIQNNSMDTTETQAPDNSQNNQQEVMQNLGDDLLEDSSK